MPTPAQLEANRANAQKSTGPKTPAGKARSSQNAHHHGLCSSQVVLLPGQEDEFNEMQAGLYAGIRPEGALEDELFQALVHAAWNQRRCRRAEADLQKKTAGQGLDPLLDPALDADLRRLDLYARRAANAFHKNLKALRDLQTERHLRLAFDEEQPGLCDFANLGLASVAAGRAAVQKERTQSARVAALEFRAEIAALDCQAARFNAHHPLNRPAA